TAIMKFGGTSVADADAIRRVAAIVGRHDESRKAGARPPVVVVSALSKVTDGLLQAARFVEGGDRGRAIARLDELAERHVSIAAAVTSRGRLAEVTRDLRSEFSTTAETIRALPAAYDAPCLHDAIAATGELASSRLLTAALAEAGSPAVWIDARKVMTTDAEHTRAAPDMSATCARVMQTVAPRAARGDIVVLGGFIGATVDGVTTTLG